MQEMACRRFLAAGRTSPACSGRVRPRMVKAVLIGWDLRGLDMRGMVRTGRFRAVSLKERNDFFEQISNDLHKCAVQAPPSGEFRPVFCAADLPSSR